MQFAEKLDPVDSVAEIFQGQTSTYLDVIVQLPASGKWQDMNSHHYPADLMLLLIFSHSLILPPHLPVHVYCSQLGL